MQPLPEQTADLPRLLIVDDDWNIRDSLKRFFLSQGFDADVAENAAAARRKLHERAPDLVILDIMMPGEDGLSLCRSIAELKTIPIILVSAKSEEIDRIIGLEIGADDYVAKPFSFAVLLARVRAQLRSFEQTEDATFDIGPYEFRPSMKALRTKEGRRIRLTEKETEILKFLYRAGGKPVARETLLSEVWGYNAAVTTHTLETHIYRLRQKVEPDPSNAQLLLTDTGGYRLRP